jgi:hypothetical protein
MAGAKTDIVDIPIEHAAIGTDVMLVEEIENSSTNKQLNKVIVFILYACFHMSMF